MGNVVARAWRRPTPPAAGPLLPLVVALGDPLQIEALSDGSGSGRSYGSRVPRFSDGHAHPVRSWAADCMQVYLTPLGARQVLGVSGSQVAR